MPHVQFDEKDLKRGQVFPIAWYRVLIEAIGEKAAKNGESTNYPVEGKILKNADDGSDTFSGYPLEWNFNSKAMGFAKGFFVAMGVVPEADKRYELAHFAGRVIDVFVENDMYDGRVVNRVNHKYRAAAAEE